MIRPVTQDCFNSMMMDEWPHTAAVVDFGLRSQAHYEGLYYPIRDGRLKIQELESVLGNGPAITELVKRLTGKEIVYATPYDTMGESE
jgi:hypothetical protein